ncbi:hypothetical protein [Haloarcula argentinensis]|uniref:CARDB domain-containing protein n=1 Tax=Haloarcula argentinensis TaxID=43776 RepID=A0A847UR05_HALAR|nr:hypothetical protein [Haloarcula argentinensis]NLV14614.1 hypothetical protein [Haloarcula argentinensis]
MDRRTYLATAVGLGSGSLTGCSSYLEGENETATNDSLRDTPTADSSGTETPIPPNRLSAGSHTVTLTNPRVRASIRDAGVHVDVFAERGSQFLVLDVETDVTRVKQLPARVVADGEPITDRLSLVGRPDTKTTGAIGFPLPVSEYEGVAVVLEADGESARWRVPDAVVELLAHAPEFVVGDIEAPSSVRSGESFTASFTVTNDGSRDARFLAEFGHTLLSDTGEVEVAVPVGERRTHTSTIEPYYETNLGEIPMILDWGIDTHRTTVAVERETSTADLPPLSDALHIESSHPIEGTMVNLGVGGMARNTSAALLTNCIIVASGDVGDRRYSGITRRDRLGPDQIWEWEVAFGDEADAQRAPVRNIEIEARAESPS